MCVSVLSLSASAAARTPKRSSHVRIDESRRGSARAAPPEASSRASAHDTWRPRRSTRCRADRIPRRVDGAREPLTGRRHQRHAAAPAPFVVTGGGAGSSSTRFISRATTGSKIFPSVAWIQVNSLSATADATKYGRLWIASTRSRGRRLPPTVVRSGPAMRICARHPPARSPAAPRSPRLPACRRTGGLRARA